MSIGFPMSRRLIRLRIIEKKRDLANALDDVLAAMADPQTGLQEVPLDAGIVPRMIPKTAGRHWREGYQNAGTLAAFPASIRKRYRGGCVNSRSNLVHLPTP